MSTITDYLRNIDPKVAQFIEKEEMLQKKGIKLIASENYASKAVRLTEACVMTNKYSEGYPGKRYYGGNEYYDYIENLAIERLKKLFKVEHANVQPHSGTQANMGVYSAILKHKDSVLAMDLANGGHLSHGSKVNFSGKEYNFYHYSLDDKGFIDYDQTGKMAKEIKPKLIVCGASSYPREINFKRFKEIADNVGAYLMADIAHIAGLIVGGVHQNASPYADFITSTTQKTLRGPRGGLIMCKEEFARKIDKAIFPGIQGGPMMHIIAAKAVCFKEALKPEFKEYAKQIVKNSKVIAKDLSNKEFNLISGGTDNHMLLVDLRNKGITGKEAQDLLERADIILNKNIVPNDPQKPMITSGVRIGTPAITTRGMNEKEMKIISELISKVIENKNNKKIIEEVKQQSNKLCEKFPVP